VPFPSGLLKPASCVSEILIFRGRPILFSP
jgi:hypothetical protein